MQLRTLLPVFLTLVLLGGTVGGCTDLSVSPKSSVSSDNAFNDSQTIRAFLAKLYGGLSVTGQQGPAGNPDLVQIDEGFSQYIRLWWQMQELPTDEAAIAWDDGNIQELNTSTWSDQNGFLSAMYGRIFFQVAQVNEFLRQSTTEQLDKKGIRQDIRPKIKQWRAEARFLRALSYWHAIDLFGAVPLVTEEDPLGTGGGESAPEMSTKDSLFTFVENELLAITNSEGQENLPPAGMAEYGRADKAAAWMVLAKLYQNAPVYLGDDRSYDASERRSASVLKYTGNVIEAYGASEGALESDYHNLFLADNHTAKGIIFAVPQDGERSQNYGNTTFLVNASSSGDLASTVGVPDGGWAGVRTTAEIDSIYQLNSGDNRPMYENIGGSRFYQTGHTRAMTDLKSFTSGYAAPKYQNITSDGERGSSGLFPDTDYPMFRLADAYLMYAEAAVRSGQQGAYDPVELVNLLRRRAGLSDITSSELDREFLLNARMRELFWEATRRMDLIRFGEFTGGTYNWSWKGDASQGTSTPGHVRLYPLPASEIQSNPNLTQDDQNPGYGG
ncbi:MAG: RagB/SusD family nutrient uptake outer membrane protein [Salinibacter sp.]